MIRIHLTEAAYDAIAAGVPEDRRLPAEQAPTGGFYLWLLKPLLEQLTAARGPGESYSDTILRLAAE